MNALSTFATKLPDFGGTGLCPFSPTKSGCKSPNSHSNWHWHMKEVFFKIDYERFYIWRAIDHEGAILECVATKRRDRFAAMKILRKLHLEHGTPEKIATDKLRSYKATLHEIGYSGHHSTAQYENNLCENSHLQFRM